MAANLERLDSLTDHLARKYEHPLCAGVSFDSPLIGRLERQAEANEAFFTRAVASGGGVQLGRVEVVGQGISAETRQIVQSGTRLAEAMLSRDPTLPRGVVDRLKLPASLGELSSVGQAASLIASRVQEQVAMRKVRIRSHASERGSIHLPKPLRSARGLILRRRSPAAHDRHIRELDWGKPENVAHALIYAKTPKLQSRATKLIRGSLAAAEAVARHFYSQHGVSNSQFGRGLLSLLPHAGSLSDKALQGVASLVGEKGATGSYARTLLLKAGKHRANQFLFDVLDNDDFIEDRQWNVVKVLKRWRPGISGRNWSRLYYLARYKQSRPGGVFAVRYLAYHTRGSLGFSSTARAVVGTLEGLRPHLSKAQIRAMRNALSWNLTRVSPNQQAIQESYRSLFAKAVRKAKEGSKVKTLQKYLVVLQLAQDPILKREIDLPKLNRKLKELLADSSVKRLLRTLYQKALDAGRPSPWLAPGSHLASYLKSPAFRLHASLLSQKQRTRLVKKKLREVAAVNPTIGLQAVRQMMARELLDRPGGLVKELLQKGRGGQVRQAVVKALRKAGHTQGIEEAARILISVLGRMNAGEAADPGLVQASVADFLKKHETKLEWAGPIFGIAKEWTSIKKQAAAKARLGRLLTAVAVLSMIKDGLPSDIESSAKFFSSSAGLIETVDTVTKFLLPKTGGLPQFVKASQILGPIASGVDVILSAKDFADKLNEKGNITGKVGKGMQLAGAFFGGTASLLAIGEGVAGAGAGALSLSGPIALVAAALILGGWAIDHYWGANHPMTLDPKRQLLLDLDLWKSQ